MLLCFAACDKDNGLNDDIPGTVQMKCTLVGEFEVQSNKATIKAEEGGELIIQSEYPSRISSICEYGESFELPIGKEYTCVEFLRPPIFGALLFEIKKFVRTFVYFSL